MIITNATLQALRTSFDASFQKGIVAAKSQYKDVSTVIPSTSASNTYGWLGAMPRLKEWIGARPMTDLKEFGYQIFNKTWADGVSVSRDAIEDDELGVYGPLLQSLGQSAATLPDEQIFSLLKNGFSSLCFDGQNFFDTDHPVYPNTDGTGTAASVANIYQQSAGWTGDPWFFLDCSKPLRPLIWQDRRKLASTAITDPQAETVFNDNEYKYGCDMRGNAGYGFWQLAYAGLADLTSDNLWTAFQGMENITGDGNTKLSLTPTHLVVPPTLRKAATQVLTREFVDTANGTVTNEWPGMGITLVVTPWVK